DSSSFRRIAPEGTSRVRCQGPDSLISKVESAARVTETAPCPAMLPVSFISLSKAKRPPFSWSGYRGSGMSIVRHATTSPGDCSSWQPSRRSGRSFCRPDSQSRMCRFSLLLQQDSRLAKRLLWHHPLQLLQDL